MVLVALEFHHHPFVPEVLEALLDLEILVNLDGLLSLESPVLPFLLLYHCSHILIQKNTHGRPQPLPAAPTDTGPVRTSRRPGTLQALAFFSGSRSSVSTRRESQVSSDRLT